MDPSSPIQPASAEGYVVQVSELLDRRRQAQARALLREALASFPDDVELLLQGARADALDDENASAMQTLRSVIARQPAHFGARAFLLGLLTDEGELAEAEQLALGMIAEHPQSPDLYAAYARVMVRALQFPKARALAQEALHLDPQNDFALRVLALCDVIELPRGTDSAALRRLLAEHPEDQHLLSLVISALLQNGEPRAALRGAREMLRQNPHNRHWLALVKQLSVQEHWTMRPLWPLQRWGWTASVVLWIGGVLGLRLLGQVNPALVGPASLLWLAYVAYSWVWPPLLRRWLLR